MALGFAAVHQLLGPFLHGVDRLPEPQQRALAVAFGLVNGPPADPFLVGLAVLTLLSDTARIRPVLCVIDDAQWLDDESADTFTFAARRLLADRVGMLFALRETTEPDPRLQALPGLRLAGLPEPDAYELLARAVGRPIEAGVAQRIVAETGGNPLAIVEVARELTPEQLRGQMPLPEPLPVGHQLEDLFVRRARELPTDTQTLLLLAAAEQPGRGDRLWQAAAALGIPESTAVPAEAAGLVVFGPEVRFSHPLVRSAVYHAAAPSQRRQAHRALAAACDPQLDAVPQAWHLAAATAGPDEAVAAQLEAAAEQGPEPWRLRRHGGAAGTRGAADAGRGAAGRAPALGSAGPPARRERSTGPTSCWSRPPRACGIRSRSRRRPGWKAGSGSIAGRWPTPPRPWSVRHGDFDRSTLAPRGTRCSSHSRLPCSPDGRPAPPSCTRSRGRRGICLPRATLRTRRPICCCGAVAHG